MKTSSPHTVFPTPDNLRRIVPLIPDKRVVTRVAMISMRNAFSTPASSVTLNLRKVLLAMLAAATSLVFSNHSFGASEDLAGIRTEISKHHEEAVKRLRDWIALPSIAAEDRNYPAGAEYMAQLARDAGFQKAVVINTDGKPGVFATLDAGAAQTVGVHFMYDVKQFDPSEWP